MEIVLSNPKSNYSEIISSGDLENGHVNLKKFTLAKETLEAKIFAINESISSAQLSKIKNNFAKINIAFTLTIGIL